MELVVAFAVVGLGILVSGFLVSRRSNRTLIEERLGLDQEGPSAPIVDGRSRSPVGDVLNRVLARRGLGSNLATQLARADMKITVGEFLSATIIFIILGGGVAFLLTRNIVIALGVTLLGFFGPRVYIGILRGRRLKAFDNQLGDTINLLVNGLRSGYSILQAMEAVASEMGPPIATEFGRVIQEVQLGLTLEEALDNMLRRITSDDLDMMITAINVQREVGGNLAEVLDAISYTIRERVRIKGEIRALTAQSRWSGYMIAMVPIVLTVVIFLINPDFMSKLFEHICGWMMIAYAVIGIGLGFLAIRKVVNIEV